MKKASFVAISFLFFSTIAFTQNKYGNNAEDSILSIKNLTQYRELIKQWEENKSSGNEVSLALNPWRFLFINTPSISSNIYVDGAKIMKYFYKTEPDSLRKQKYFDTLMMVYDQRVKYFGKEGFVLGRKANDMFSLNPKLVEETYQTYKKSIELQGNESEASVANNFFVTAINFTKTTKTNDSIIFDAYNKSIGICNYHTSVPSDTVYYSPVIRNIESLILPYANCDILNQIYYKKMNRIMRDSLLMKNFILQMDQNGCQSDSLYLKVYKGLFSISPTTAYAIRIAKLEVERQNLNGAIVMYQQAIDMESNESIKANYFFNLAEICQKFGNNELAKKYCHKALTLIPNMGKAYLLIGEIIATTPKCGVENNMLDQNSVYWLAVDYFQKAKSIDPSVMEDANKLIRIYSVKFPKKEDALVYQVKEGDYFIVPCYNEKTRARF